MPLPKCVAIPNSDVNKDWTCKDKDKDQAYKHQDKDLNLVLKESLRTRTSFTVTYCKLQLNLQSPIKQLTTMNTN